VGHGRSAKHVARQRTKRELARDMLRSRPCSRESHWC
jgi:hypothetical protein